jgi:hypothetical protein
VQSEPQELSFPIAIGKTLAQSIGEGQSIFIGIYFFCGYRYLLKTVRCLFLNALVTFLEAYEEERIPIRLAGDYAGRGRRACSYESYFDNTNVSYSSGNDDDDEEYDTFYMDDTVEIGDLVPPPLNWKPRKNSTQSSSIGSVDYHGYHRHSGRF